MGMKFLACSNFSNGPIVSYRPTNYLSRKDDPRPRCTLVIGDGFTQGYLHARGFHSEIECGINNHFPPQNDATYIPVQDDRFELQKLWSPDLWPNIFKVLKDNKLQGMELYTYLSSYRINPSQENGFWDFETNSIAYEVRAYLWHLFRFYDWKLKELAERDKNKRFKWLWIDILYMLKSEFSLSIVSYNYDLLLENVLNSIKSIPGPIVCYFIELLERNPDYIPVNAIPVFKPHGSISYLLNYGNFNFGSNPWLEVNAVHNCYDNTAVTNISPKMDIFPSVPDIVPPGHAGDHLCNPHSMASKYAQQEITQANLVIFCGLSGNEPDRLEIYNLIQSIKDDSQLLHIGIEDNGDYDNNVGKMLRELSQDRYTFIDANHLDKLFSYISSTFQLLWKWNSKSD